MLSEKIRKENTNKCKKLVNMRISQTRKRYEIQPKKRKEESRKQHKSREKKKEEKR